MKGMEEEKTNGWMDVCVIQSISVIPLANEQLRVLCIDPEISLKKKNNLSVKEIKETQNMSQNTACYCGLNLWNLHFPLFACFTDIISASTDA